MARKKKKRSLIAEIVDGLLSLVDFICEGIAGAAVGLLAAFGRGLMLLLRGALWLLYRAAGLLLAVPVWIFRKLIMNGM